MNHSRIEVLENVKQYFEKNGGVASQECLVMAKTAVKKAQEGQYGICSCGHRATKKEIFMRPFFCAKCEESFV